MTLIMIIYDCHDHDPEEETPARYNYNCYCDSM